MKTKLTSTSASSPPSLAQSHAKGAHLTRPLVHSPLGSSRGVESEGTVFCVERLVSLKLPRQSVVLPQSGEVGCSLFSKQSVLTENTHNEDAKGVRGQ